ncbi:MAG: long-chain fatty acid--CoA ligase [Acidobacteriota bacterium]
MAPSSIDPAAVAHGARTVGDMVWRRALATPDKLACLYKANDRWHEVTWKELVDEAASVAAELIELGLEPGDTISICGPTAVDWICYDLGGHLAGVVTVGIYPKQSAEQVRFLLEHSETKVVFSHADELATVLEATEGLDSVIAIVPWDESDADHHADPRVISSERFRGVPLDAAAIEARQAACDPDDLAILIYTSGTTGPPKGAMLSHRNILAMVTHLLRAFPYREDDLLFAFLPMAHSTERVMSFYARIHSGTPAAYATSIGHVLAELPEVRPTIFGSVPRLFEKAHVKIHGEMEKKSKTVQSLFAWAVGVGRRRAEAVLAGRPIGPWLALQDKLATKLVFAKIHQAFGGRVRCFVTGAAPVAHDILRFFWATGVPMYEAYGMTEATVVTHINRPEAARLGTVGMPIAPTEQRIADDGEILLSGPTVFMGYFKNPEATAETLVDGWLHTGDIGKIDDDGYLAITDRKKHLIITAGGKNVAPANIERAVKTESPLISQVHAHGDRRPFVSALIAPSPLETLEWGADHDVISRDELDARRTELLANPSARSTALNEAMAKVVAEPTFQALFVEPVQRGNRNLARVERIRRFVLLERDFSHEEGELTPTMKMKRRWIERHYADLFERIYTDPSFAIDAEPEDGMPR